MRISASRLGASIAFTMLSAAALNFAHAGFFTMKSENFDFCSASAYCAGEQECVHQQLDEDGWCATSCGAGNSAYLQCQITESGSDVMTYGSSGFREIDAQWDQVSVGVSFEVLPGSLQLHVDTDRADATTLAEAAVFRFAGDPNVFLGVEVVSVAGLVDLGLIGAGDLLWLEDDFPLGVNHLDVEVDIDGILPEEIVVFVGGEAAGHWSCETAEDCHPGDSEPPDVSALPKHGRLMLAAVLGALGVLFVFLRRA